MTRRWQDYVPACDAWWNTVRLSQQDELIWDGFDWASVEFATHELCHAAVLGEFPLPRLLVTFVTSCCAQMPRFEAVEQEIKTSAIQYYVMQELGIPFEKGDIVAAVDVQQIDECPMMMAMESPEPLQQEINSVLQHLDEWREAA